jgi:hypothetical protein
LSEVVTRSFLDSSEKKIVFHRSQDVEDILDRNAMLRSLPQKSDWGRHIASIPCVILEKWMNDSGVRYERMRASERNEWLDRLIQEKLNDPDWKYLRTDK